jgi:hypothetical protein
MSARIQSPMPLDTAEEVCEAYDAWARNPSCEMKVREVGIGGTMVVLFSAGQQVAVGRGRGLVNAIADAFEEMRADEASR